MKANIIKIFNEINVKICIDYKISSKSKTNSLLMVILNN